jgi:hypothetical protein
MLTWQRPAPSGAVSDLRFSGCGARLVKRMTKPAWPLFDQRDSSFD